MLFGFFFVHPVPLPEQGSSELEDGDDFREPTLSPALQPHDHSRTPLLNDDSFKDRYVRTNITTNGEYSNSVGGVMDVTRSVQVVSSQIHSLPLNIHGRALLSNLDFWLLFCISSLRMFPFSGFRFFKYLTLQEQFLGLVIHVCLESF
jgi:hypothetical protein